MRERKQTSAPVIQHAVNETFLVRATIYDGEIVARRETEFFGAGGSIGLRRRVEGSLLGVRRRWRARGWEGTIRLLRGSPCNRRRRSRGYRGSPGTRAHVGALPSAGGHWLTDDGRRRSVRGHCVQPAGIACGLRYWLVTSAHHWGRRLGLSGGDSLGTSHCRWLGFDYW